MDGTRIPTLGLDLEASWILKAKLRWIQKTPTPRVAQWRITNYLKVMHAAVESRN